MKKRSFSACKRSRPFLDMAMEAGSRLGRLGTLMQYKRWDWWFGWFPCISLPHMISQSKIMSIKLRASMIIIKLRCNTICIVKKTKLMIKTMTTPYTDWNASVILMCKLGYLCMAKVIFRIFILKKVNRPSMTPSDWGLPALRISLCQIAHIWGHRPNEIGFDACPSLAKDPWMG